MTFRLKYFPEKNHVIDVRTPSRQGGKTVYVHVGTIIAGTFGDTLECYVRDIETDDVYRSLDVKGNVNKARKVLRENLKLQAKRRQEKRERAKK